MHLLIGAGDIASILNQLIPGETARLDRREEAQKAHEASAQDFAQADTLAREMGAHARASTDADLRRFAAKNPKRLAVLADVAAAQRGADAIG